MYLSIVSLFALDDRGHDLQVAAQHLGQLVRRHLLGERGEVADVGEEHGKLRGRCAQLRFLAVAVELPHKIDGHVFAHRAHSGLRAFEAAEHFLHVAQWRLMAAGCELEAVHARGLLEHEGLRAAARGAAR